MVPTVTRKRVAILGAGRMGGAMVRRLHGSGFDVAVWNRTPSRAADAVGASGARIADSAQEAVADADVVISSLADDAAVRDVYLGAADGVVGALRGEAVVAEMSTIAPETVREIGRRIEEHGAAVVDAPVSGSVAFTEKGELTIMVGGDAEALARARPVLDALSARLIHVGDLGAGATMKLAINALVHGLNVALSESLVLAERAGVERTVAYEVFATGATGAPFVHYKRAAYEDPEESPVGFSLDLVAKDLDLILGLAGQTGTRMDQAATNRSIVRAAVDTGMAERDLSALAVFLRGDGRSR